MSEDMRKLPMHVSRDSSVQKAATSKTLNQKHDWNPESQCELERMLFRH